MIRSVADVAVVEQLREFFARDAHGCAAVYLFGSRARDDFRDDSDVDVAVLWETMPDDPWHAMLGLMSALSDVCGREVDVVVLNTASADVRHRVLRHECLILDRNRSARIKFEVATRNEYFDLLPMLRRIRKMAS